MFNIKYRQWFFDLSKSIMIKCELTAYTMQKLNNLPLESAVTLNRDSKNIAKRTWKYYLNITGSYHEIDQPIKITHTGLGGDPVVLDKTLINNNPWLKTELLKRDKLYNDIIDEYPDYYLFINGLISDIDLDTAIKAKPGTILAYNNQLLDSKEKNLIEKLNTFTCNYYERWCVNENALVDEYYLEGFIHTLYSLIPSKIYDIRMGNILTHNVNDVFMDLKFGSTYDLTNAMSKLSDDVRLWMYKNLDYLTGNIGQNKVLDLLARNVVNKSKYMLLNVELDQREIEFISENLNDRFKPTFRPDNLNIVTRDIIDRNLVSSMTIRELLERQAGLTESTLTDNIENYISSLDNVIGRDEIPTKSLIIEKTKYLEILPNNLISHLLDSMIFHYKTDNPTYILSIKDKVNGLEIPMTIKEGIVIVLYMIERLLNRTINVETYKLSILYDNLLPNIEDKYLTDTFKNIILPELKKYIPNNTMIDESGFKSYIVSTLNYYEKITILLMNTDNPVYYSDIDRFYKAKQGMKDIVLDFGDLREHLLNNGFDLTALDNIDPLTMISNVITTFTSIDPKVLLIENKILESLTEIVNKLSSYAVHVLPEPTLDNIDLIYRKTNVLSDLNIVRIDDIEPDCLEPVNDAKIIVKADDTINRVNGFMVTDSVKIEII